MDFLLSFRCLATFNKKLATLPVCKMYVGNTQSQNSWVEMVEEQRARVEEAMTKLVNEVDKLHLRKIQAEMHRCAARCCDNNDASVEKVHQCVENCSIPLNHAQKYVQGEFEHLQNRLQRCVMQCNDEIRDKMGANPTETEISRYSQDFENCAVKCVDHHLGLLPSMLKKMKEVLSQGKYHQLQQQPQ